MGAVFVRMENTVTGISPAGIRIFLLVQIQWITERDRDMSSFEKGADRLWT